MNPNFVRQFAPELSLEPAAPRGGLNVEQPYDAQGTPLPWMQEQGGQRQYFGTPGGLAVEQPADAQGTPLPFVQSQGTRQYFGTPGADGLRGRTPEEPSNPAPQNVLIETGRPGNTARIPPLENIEAQIRGGAGLHRVGPTRETIENRAAGGATAERTMQALRNPEGMTLGDVLGQFNFQIPSFLRTDGLRGRMDERRTIEEPINPASVDPNVDLDRGVAQSGQRFNVSTSEGLADFNQRMGLNIGNQVRTQAEQDSLFRRGLAPSRTSRHLTGEAVDITPRQLGGLTGQEAVAEVRRRLYAAGYSDMYVQWESGHGRNQGTGAHVHVQPPRQRR